MGALNMWRRHEIAGVVTKVGSNVSKFKVGDRVGVGYSGMMCEQCDSCKGGIDCCTERVTRVFNDVDVDGTITRGGFSDLMQANQRCAIEMLKWCYCACRSHVC